MVNKELKRRCWSKSLKSASIATILLTSSILSSNALGAVITVSTPTTINSDSGYANSYQFGAVTTLTTNGSNSLYDGISFNGFDSIINVNANSHIASITNPTIRTTSANTGTLILNSTNNITNGIGSATYPIKLLQYKNAGNVSGSIYANSIEIGTGSIVVSGSDISGNISFNGNAYSYLGFSNPVTINGNINFINNQTTILNLDQGGTFSGTIDSIGGSNGIIQVINGNTTFNNIIGITNPIGRVYIGKNTTSFNQNTNIADLQVAANFQTGNVLMNGDFSGGVTVNDKGTITFAGKVNTTGINGNDTNYGTVNINNISTFTGPIGNTIPVKQINLINDKILNLDVNRSFNAQYINLPLGGTVKLSDVAQTVQNIISDDGAGGGGVLNLQLDGDFAHTINANIGSNAAPFSSLSFTNGIAESATRRINGSIFVNSISSDGGRILFNGPVVTGSINLTNSRSSVNFSQNANLGNVDMGNISNYIYMASDKILTGNFFGSGANGVIVFSGNGTLVNSGSDPILPTIMSSGGTVNLAGTNTNLQLQNNNSKFVLANGITVSGNIVPVSLNSGDVEFLGNGTVNGVIGYSFTSLKNIIFNAGDVNLNSTVRSQNLFINNSTSNVTIAELVTDNIQYNDAGTLTINDGVIGNISRTTTNPTILNLGGGTVNGTINLPSINFTNTSPSIVTLNGVVTSTILNIGAGDVVSNANITGNIKFTSDSRFTITNGATITGSVITDTDNTGILTLLGTRTITNSIGSASNRLKNIELSTPSGSFSSLNSQIYTSKIRIMNGQWIANQPIVSDIVITENIGRLDANKPITGNISFELNPNTRTVNNPAQLNAHADINGNIDFNIQNSQVFMYPNANIIGNVDNSTNAPYGSLTIYGNSKVTGKIGASHPIPNINLGDGYNTFPIPGINVITLEETVNSSAIYIADTVNVHKLITTDWLCLTFPSSVVNIMAGLTGKSLLTNLSTMNIFDAVTIDGAIDGPGGIVNTLGNATFNKDIGTSNTIAELNFTGLGDVLLKGKVNATKLKFTAGTNVIVNNTVTGAVEFSADGILSLNNLTGSVITNTDNTGTIKFLGVSTITKSIGALNKKLKNVIFAQNAGVTATLNGDLYSYDVNIVKGTVIANLPITSNITLTEQTAILNANKNITGNIYFAGNNGTVNISNGANITGNIDNGGANAAGILNFTGNNIVSGQIGVSTPISTININGPVTLEESVRAATINVDHGTLNLNQNIITDNLYLKNSDVIVNSSTNLISNVTFGAAATLNTMNITGNIDFSGNNATINVLNGVNITGNINNNGTANSGMLKFAGNNIVTGKIGEFAPISTINVNGTLTLQNSVTASIIDVNHGTLNLNQNVTSDNLYLNNPDVIVNSSDNLTANVTFGESATLNASNIIGNIDFVGFNGTLSLNDAGNITGNIDNSGATIAGILNFSGSNIATGTIGQTTPISEINVNAVVYGVTLQESVRADNVKINAGTLNITKDLSGNLSLRFGTTANIFGNLFGNATLTSGGTLNSSNVTGNITFDGYMGTVNLKENANIIGNITANRGNYGASDLNFAGNNIVKGTITTNGSFNININGPVTLEQYAEGTINVNQGTLNINAFAGYISVNKDGAIVNVNDDWFGNINLFELSTLNIFKNAANSKYNGNINYVGKNAIVNIANGANITGDVNNYHTTVAGILNLTGNNIVKGKIGESNPISEININGDVTFEESIQASNIHVNDGILNLDKNIITDNLYLNNDNIIVNSLGDLTANVTFGGTATLNTSNLIGNIDLSGFNGIITLSNGANIAGNIDNNGTANAGTLTLAGNNIISGTIGATKAISIINSNGDISLQQTVNAQTINANHGTLNLNQNVTSDNLYLNNPDVIVNSSDNLTANVTFGESATLNASNIIGNIDFVGFNGTLSLNDGGNITGNIDNSGATEAGILTFAGLNIVTGTIGTAKAILTINANGSVILQNSVFAQTINANHGTLNLLQNITSDNLYLNNSDTIVNSMGNLNSNITFDAVAILNTSNITGNLDFAGNNGNVSISNSGNITGNIDNSGVVATGTLTLAGNNIISGTIGATKAISIINSNGDISLQQTVNAQTINANHGTLNLNQNVTSDNLYLNNPDVIVNSSDNLTANVTFGESATLNASNIIGNIDFVGFNGILSLNDGGNITGNIDNSGTTEAGILNLPGNNIISGKIGETSPISIININGAVTLQDSVHTSRLNVNHGTLNLSQNIITDNLYLNNDDVIVNLTGNFSRNATFGGAATLNASNITGNVDFYGFNGVINLSNNSNITGNIDNNGANVAGILNFAGDNIVSGKIGEHTPIATININGPVTLQDAVRASRVNANHGTLNLLQNIITDNLYLNNDDVLVNLIGNFSHNATFQAPARLNISNFTGNIDFSGFNGLVNLSGNILVKLTIAVLMMLEY